MQHEQQGSKGLVGENRLGNKLPVHTPFVKKSTAEIESGTKVSREVVCEKRQSQGHLGGRQIHECRIWFVPCSARACDAARFTWDRAIAATW